MAAERATVVPGTGAVAAPAVRASAALGRTVLSIQFLRFVAAFAVVVFHAHQAIAAGNYGYPPALAYLFGLGASGVHIFFCISGFVMVYTSFCHDAGRFSPLDFLRKRTLRIYPIYWACAAVYLAFHLATHGSYPITARETIRALALMPGDAALIIGPAWTLAFEMYFYLCFCVFMLAGLVPGLTLMSIFFLASVLAGMFGIPVPLNPFMLNSLLLEFVAGAWLGYLAIRRPEWLAGTRHVALLLGVAGFVAGYAIGYDRLPSAFGWGIPSLLLLSGTIGMEAAGRLPRPMARLAFLGDGSYFLYLSHILLIDLLLLTPLAWLRWSTAGVIAGTLVAAAICVALSVPAFERIERPMLRGLRRWTHGRPPAAA